MELRLKMIKFIVKLCVKGDFESDPPIICVIRNHYNLDTLLYNNVKKN